MPDEPFNLAPRGDRRPDRQPALLDNGRLGSVPAQRRGKHDGLDDRQRPRAAHRHQPGMRGARLRARVNGGGRRRSQQGRITAGVSPPLDEIGHAYQSLRVASADMAPRSWSSW